MARQPALNQEALLQLGAEKLAGLVIDAANRDAAFKKLVMASLASAKSPAAVAAIIDKRLAGLDRAKGFVGWEKAKAFTADMAAILAIIVGELAQADADAARERLVRFLSTANRTFERIDDSSGRLQEVYRSAAAALPDLVERLPEVEKAAAPDWLFPLGVADSYGFVAAAMPEILARLPAQSLSLLDERLAEAALSQAPAETSEKDWVKRARVDRLVRFRQQVADCRQDVDAFIALENSRADGPRDAIAIAERLADVSRHSEALKWLRRPGRDAVKYLGYDDLADGVSPRDLADIARMRLEIRILEAMGDRVAAQELRWRTFETLLDVDMLRDHLGHLGDFEEFDVLDKAFAHVLGAQQKYRALSFLLSWPRLDLAAKLVVERRCDWEGRHYEILAAAAQTLEPDHPLAATILYRALLEDILDRARSPAYSHGARYLKRLDALSEGEDPTWPIDSQRTYRLALQKKHGRKSGFWSLVEERGTG